MTNLNIAKVANIFRGRWTLMHELSEIYKPAMTRNKAKLMELIREKTESATKSGFARKMQILKGFYSLEMAPLPTGDEKKRILATMKLSTDFIKENAFKYLTVKQAWLLFLVGLEVFLWFFIGETIGKWHLVGYKVTK